MIPDGLKQKYSERFVLKQQYTFFSSLHETFSRKDHILGHITGINKFKKTKIIPCTFSDHSAMKLEVNNKKKFKRPQRRLKNMLLNNEWVNQEIKEEIKKIHRNK